MPKRERVRVGDLTFCFQDCGLGPHWYVHVAGAVYTAGGGEVTLLLALLRCRKRLARVLEDWVPRVRRRKPRPPYTLKQAKRMRVCRVCGDGETDGPGLPFVYNYGKEYAHQKCLKGGRRAR